MKRFFRISKIMLILTFVLLEVATFCRIPNVIIYKISYIIIFLICILPISFLYKVIDNIRFNDSIIYWKNGEIEKFIKIVEKRLKDYNKKSTKFHLELLLAQCYNQTNRLEQTKKIIMNIEPILNDSKTSNRIKVSILSVICEYYILINDYKEADNILMKIYDIYSKNNLNAQSLDQNFRYTYNRLYFMIYCHDSKNKKVLKEAEKFYMNGIDKQTLIVKIVHADQLVTIYEKLGNKEKAKEYAKFLIENHKDYYIDSKRIEKYSK